MLKHTSSMVTALLGRHGFPLAEPVATYFRDGANGSSGIGVKVRLLDAARVEAARALIAERFGGADPDAFDVA